jgi:hypothetical protein
MGIRLTEDGSDLKVKLLKRMKPIHFESISDSSQVVGCMLANESIFDETELSWQDKVAYLMIRQLQS